MRLVAALRGAESVRRADQPKRRIASRWRLVRSKSGGADSRDGLRVSLGAPAPARARPRRSRWARASSKMRSSRASSSRRLCEARVEPRAGVGLAVVVEASPTTRQYGRGTWASTSSSRSTSSASVGVCTRPADQARLLAAALEALGERARRVHPDQPVGARAALARRRPRPSSSSPGRSRAKPSRIASSVIDWSQSRRIGLRDPEVLDDLAEDQLALAPGVAGVHDRRRRRRARAAS